jgi:peptide/nickel transport system substrate-binding protein
MTDEQIARRKVLSTLAVGAGVSVAGCSGTDSVTTTTDTGGGGGGGGGDDDSDTDSESTDTDTPTSTPSEDQLQDSMQVALPTDPTAGVWEVYGGVTPYYTNILEPLIWVSNEMELVPWLATDWESTGDKTWEFTLRDGVTFHNGETMNADHVVWSVKKILNEWAWAPGWLHLNPDGVAKVDDMTVEFTTTDPFPTFPGTIAHNMVAVQHPDRSREDKEVIATGPFQMTNRKKGQRVETERHEDYWNSSPNMENLTFRIISDPTTRALSLENQEVDTIFSPPKSKIDSLEKSDKTNVKKRTTPGAMFVGLHNYKEPTSDVKLRKALNYATSQPTLVETILNNVGLPARGPIAESIYWSAHEKLPKYERDKQKAKSLVGESSYSGQTLNFLISSETTDGKTIASALQQWYSEIGVDVSIQQLEQAAYDDAVRNGKGHLMLETSSSNSGAADYLIYETFHSQGDVNQRLYKNEDTGLFNPGGEADTLINEGFQTGDKAKKETKYEQALEIIMKDEAAVVPLTYQQYVVGTTSKVQGLDLRPINEMVRWPGVKHLK